MSGEVDVSDVSTNSLADVIRMRAGLRDVCPCNFDIGAYAYAVHHMKHGNLDEALIYLERAAPDLDGLRALVARKLKGE